jgi:hypothetical protein
MLGEEVKIELSKFAKAVIKASRQNLTKKGKIFNKTLYNSLDYELRVMKNSFAMSFLMERYGLFVDQGVKGANPSKVKGGDKAIRGQQAPNSPFRFGSGNFKGTWGTFVNNIEKWVKKKNLRLRDEKGRFTKGTYRTIAQIVAGNIYNRGIKPTMFFTKPFEAAFKRLPDDLIKKFGLEVEEFLEFTTKNITNGN